MLFLCLIYGLSLSFFFFFPFNCFLTLSNVHVSGLDLHSLWLSLEQSIPFQPPSVAAWFYPYGATVELVALHDDDNFCLNIYIQS